jgi:hypothetical protein
VPPVASLLGGRIHDVELAAAGRHARRRDAFARHGDSMPTTGSGSSRMPNRPRATACVVPAFGRQNVLF